MCVLFLISAPMIRTIQVDSLDFNRIYIIVVSWPPFGCLPAYDAMILKRAPVTVATTKEKLPSIKDGPTGLARARP